MKKLIFDGQITDNESFDIEKIIAQLKEQQDYLHSIKIDDLIDYFGAVADYWQKIGLNKRYPYLKNISDFINRKNLTTTLSFSLRGDHLALDKFVEIPDQKYLIHAQPRGLTAHWLAGNVSVLGLFSIFSALITKNACLIKASSRSHEELIALLSALSEVKTEAVEGKKIAKSIAVILLDHDETVINTAISQAADVRIAWGGMEAIETIVGLPKSIYSEDIVFGPKYSYALIDQESLALNAKKIAQRLAVDTSVFDQYACSSPHTVFVQGEANKVKEFAAELGKQMDFVNRTMLPKETIDPAKAMGIISLRSEYQMTGRVFNSSGTEWTVIYSDEPGLAKGCFSRVIFVKPIKDILDLKQYNDRQKQTLGVAMTKENKLKYLDQITQHGIDRCPDLGYATFYELPWDGSFIFDRLVRWVSTYR